MNLAELRYAPEFRVTINDEPAPAALRASITNLSYQTGLEGSDRVELNLVNENLRWLDHPLLAMENQLTLFIGYAPDRLEQVFVGEIVGQEANFASSGTPTLTVTAQDRIFHLQQGSNVRWFAISTPSVGNFPLPESAVAESIGREQRLTPILDPVGAALSILLGDIQAVGAGDPDSAQKVIRKQNGESDFDFLMRLAHENGWEMMIDHTGAQGGQRLRFLSPQDHLAPEVTLKYGQSLTDFTPRISDVGQLAAVTAYVWVAPLKRLFTVTVGWDWKRMELTLDIQPESIPPGEAPSGHLIEEPVTPLSAPRKIISEFIPKLNQRQTGSGNSIGDPRVRAGTVLRLEGLGEQFGGLYRVTSATHTIDGGGYRTRFEVRKEIWFSAIPLSEQGAVPVQGLTPFVS